MPHAPRLGASLAAMTAALVAVIATFAVPAGAKAAPYVNPVANHPWGIYQGNSDGLWPAYEAATGARRTLLAKEALRPRVRRYTDYIPTSDITEKISSDIADQQHGNPNVLVWM